MESRIPAKQREETAVHILQQQNQAAGAVGSIRYNYWTVLTGLFLCNALLGLHTVANAQPTTQAGRPLPGWYYDAAGTKPGEPKTLYGDGKAGLRIIWENSFIYQHPGAANLYWYAEVVYANMSSSPTTVTCAGRTDPSLAKEWMRGTEGLASGISAYVPASETFCSRNPNFAASLAPGEVHMEWAIFHNVPPEGELSIEWNPYASSPWVNPWFSAYPPNTPAPDECPPELVTLGTCQPADQYHARRRNNPGLLLQLYCFGGKSGVNCPTPEQLQQLIQSTNSKLSSPEVQQFEDTVFCAGELGAYVAPELGVIKVVKDIGKIEAVRSIGSEFIVAVRGRTNPNNWYILAFDIGKQVAGIYAPTSCLELVALAFMGPYEPAVIPAGAPTPTPTPPLPMPRSTPPSPSPPDPSLNCAPGSRFCAR